MKKSELNKGDGDEDAYRGTWIESMQVHTRDEPDQVAAERFLTTLAIFFADSFQRLFSHAEV